MIPSLPRSGRLLLLGTLLASPTTIASAQSFTGTLAAPTARERSQLMVAEGDAAYANDHIEEAISKYRASYYSLTLDDQSSYLGSLPVRKAMRAYDQLVEKESDELRKRALLHRQRVLLTEFLDAVAAKDGASEDVGEDVVAELEEKRRWLDELLNEHDAPEETPIEEAPEVERETDELDRDETAISPLPSEPPRDWLGLGLVIGGSTTLAAGIGVGVGYLTIRNGADALIDAGGDGRDPEEITTYREQEYARAQRFLIAGSVVAGVGLAVVAGGVVRLVLHRRNHASGETAWRLLPSVASTAASLTFHRRF